MVRRVAVTVEDREPPGVVEVDIERLAAGDIVVDSVGIERKTLRDYV
jgi:ERCC4-type nuclease